MRIRADKIGNQCWRNGKYIIPHSAPVESIHTTEELTFSVASLLSIHLTVHAFRQNKPFICNRSIWDSIFVGPSGRQRLSALRALLVRLTGDTHGVRRDVPYTRGSPTLTGIHQNEEMPNSAPKPVGPQYKKS